MTRWYRAYAGTIKDDKLAEAAVVAGCSRSVVIATWHAILESAAETASGVQRHAGDRPSVWLGNPRMEAPAI
jgi:hypothetical protein